jgi:hypothetical protein
VVPLVVRIVKEEETPLAHWLLLVGVLVVEVFLRLEVLALEVLRFQEGLLEVVMDSLDVLPALLRDLERDFLE